MCNWIQHLWQRSQAASHEVGCLCISLAVILAVVVTFGYTVATFKDLRDPYAGWEVWMAIIVACVIFGAAGIVHAWLEERPTPMPKLRKISDAATNELEDTSEQREPNLSEARQSRRYVFGEGREEKQSDDTRSEG